MEKIDLEKLTEKEREELLNQIVGFIKRYAPEVTAEDFKRKRNEHISGW